MRIKAICIPAPLSFPLPFIYPSVTPPEPIPSAHSPQQSTAPTWKTSLKGGGKKIYKYITSTHFTVIPLSSLSPWSFHSLPRPLVLFPSDLKLPNFLSFSICHLLSVQLSSTSSSTSDYIVINDSTSHLFRYSV